MSEKRFNPATEADIERDKKAVAEARAKLEEYKADNKTVFQGMTALRGALKDAQDLLNSHLKSFYEAHRENANG